MSWEETGGERRGKEYGTVLRQVCVRRVRNILDHPSLRKLDSLMILPPQPARNCSSCRGTCSSGRACRSGRACACVRACVHLCARARVCVCVYKLMGRRVGS